MSTDVVTIVYGKKNLCEATYVRSSSREDELESLEEE